MKKIIYSLCAFISMTLASRAQSIPNGNFESWTVGTCDVLTGYSNSNAESYFRCNTGCNAVKTTDSYHGTHALQLTTHVSGDTCFAYEVSSTNPNGNNPCNWPGGIPYSGSPTGLMGYYKSAITSPDSGGILVAFRNNGVCLGMYMFKFGGTHSTYTPFSFNFNPPLSGTPDTMNIAAISSDVFSNIALNGSMLQLDSVSLVGSAQPAAMNGDFENWTSENFYSLNNWYTMSDRGQGLTQTSDAKAGQYAAELITYLGDNNGVPKANAGGISTGYYLNNCGGPNCMRGGNPFTNQVDTLCFYYKFAPMANDTAEVSLQFKKNFNMVYNNWKHIYTPASTYQYVEMPFNTMTAIDSVIVSFQSSNWRDSLLTFIGTDFKVDEVHFKSQPLTGGIRGYDPTAEMNVYPNPAENGNFIVTNVQYFDLVRVLNVYGQEVNASIRKETDGAHIHISTPGAYFVYVNSRGKITTQKVLVGK